MRHPLLGRAVLAAALLFVLLLALRLNTDPDLGFHLNAGDRILDTRSVPRDEVATYTGTGNRYLDQHWLYQAALSSLRRAGGFPALTLANAALLAAVFLMLAVRLRAAGVPDLLAAAGVVLAAVVMERRFELRPEVATWFFLSVYLLVLERRLRGDRKSPLWVLPILAPAWANTQALLVLGLAAAVFGALDLRLREGRWDRPLLTATAAGAALALANPYGVQGALFPLELWRHLSSGLYGGTIDEFRSPWTLLFKGDPVEALLQFGVYYLLVPAALLVLLRRGSRPFDRLLGGAFLILSLAGARNVPLFVLAVLPATLSALVRAIPGPAGRPPTAAVLGGILLVGLMSLRVLTGAWYEDGRSIGAFGLGIKTSEYPERAAVFLSANGLTGTRPFNDIPAGNWLQWRCGMRVFVDGRLEAIREEAYRDLLASGMPGGLRRAVEKWGAGLVVLDPRLSAAVSNGRLRDLPDWVLVSAEECALVFVPRSAVVGTPRPDWDALLADRGIRPAGRLEALGILTRKPASGSGYWLEGFWRKRTYDAGLANLAGTAYLTGRPDVAEAVALRLVEATRGTKRELYGNLAGLYRATGRPELAAAAARWAR